MLYTSNSFTITYPLEEADVVLLGIPFDSTAPSEGGQRYGPLTIREALKHRISYQEDLEKNPLKDLKIHDLGDLTIVPGDYEETERRIKETTKEAKQVNEDAFMVFLGGEHTVSLGTVKSLEPKTVVQLDAHKDLTKDVGGNEYAISTWARKIPEETDLIQAGIREWTKEEGEMAVKKLDDLEDASEPIYLTIDIDVLDPAYAPDVGYPEPNGLTPGELDDLLDRIFEKEVIGMDICEVASKEINNRTSYLAGWLLLRSLSYYTKNI